MHNVIQNGLEDYLGGTVRRDFQAHLDECSACRGEVREFSAISGLLVALRPQEAIPDPGFYARLSERLIAQRKPSFWSVFSLDPAFGRRIAFASLMTLALLGGFLVSQESDYKKNVMGPEAIMASHDSAVFHAPGEDRDRMMVTLASYTQ